MEITQSEFKKTVDFGNRLIWSNEEEFVQLEAWHTPHLPNWAGEFSREFNGEFKSFKTFTGLKNDVARLIKKFNLVEGEL